MNIKGLVGHPYGRMFYLNETSRHKTSRKRVFNQITELVKDMSEDRDIQHL